MRDIEIVEANIRQDNSQSGLAHVARVSGKYGWATTTFRFVLRIPQRDINDQPSFQMCSKTRRRAALGRRRITTTTTAQASFEVFDKS